MSCSLRTILLVTTLAAVTCHGWIVRTHCDSIYGTGRSLDIAIIGRGYFQLLDANTSRYSYTRRGHFHLDPSGFLVWGSIDSSLRLEPPICIPDDYNGLRISSTGVVHAHVQNIWLEVGRLSVAIFETRNTVCSQSANPGLQAPGELGAGFVKAGWLEGHPIHCDRCACRIAPVVLVTIIGWFIQTCMSRGGN